MAKESLSYSSNEPRNGGWDALLASVDDLVRRRSQTAHASDKNLKLTLRDRVDRGECAVPIYRIAIGTHHEPPFERWLSSPSPAPLQQPDLPNEPVELYKVGETYFVRDGNKRLAAARSRSQLFLRAHVVEFSSDTPARPADVLHMLVEQEHDDFFAAIPFPAHHPAHAFTASSLGTFDALGCHIQQLMPLLQQVNLNGDNTLLAWYDRIYLPVAHLIRRRHIMGHFPACTELELFLWAVYRDGPWTCQQTLQSRMHAVRRNVASLYIALHAQPVRT